MMLGMTDGVFTQRLLRERVAEEVRALLARRMMTGADLATAIGKSPMYVSRRVRGEVAFDLDDMERLAVVFGVDVADLLPRRAGSSQGAGTTRRTGDLNDSSRQIIPSAVTTRPNARTGSHVATRTGPLGHGRRDATGPVSAVPANLRRPTPTRPPARPTPR